MQTIFKKLNLGEQKELVVLQAPSSFEPILASLPQDVAVIRTADHVSCVAFALIFVTRQSEIDTLVPQIAPHLAGDALLWMCYPKGTSKNYKCDFNRDTGWQLLGNYGLEPVRMVAIDDDWSALRFRKAEYIKKMTRSFGALSEAGKIKSGQQPKS
jgi:hypothetical protein